MLVAKMPSNERDGFARVHDLDNDGYEIWIHHKNTNTEFAVKYRYDNEALAYRFVDSYNDKA